jgi:hypothetical protein
LQRLKSNSQKLLRPNLKKFRLKRKRRRGMH